MAYVPTNWVDGETPITAEKLNKIELGIVNIDRKVGKLTAGQILDVVTKMNLISLESLQLLQQLAVDYDSPTLFNRFLSGDGTWKSLAEIEE